MKLRFIVAFVIVSFGMSYGQQVPIYNQYVFDPYLINPSYITHNGFSQLNLLYKVQWTGINDAPTTSALNFQYVASKRISLGLSVYNEDVVLLSTTSALATFGYKVPLNRQSVLAFGLSAGALMNRLKLEELEDTNDPVFLNASNSTRPDAQFGINFTHKRLTFGVSLLELFQNNPFEVKEFTDVTFSKFDNRAATISYRFSLGENVEFTPYLLHRSTKNYSYFEGTGLLSFKNLITVGGFYREGYGPGFLVRIRLSPRMDVGYSYEFATDQADDYLGGSHEAQFKLNFGPQAEPLLTRNDIGPNDSMSKNEMPPAEKPQPDKTEEDPGNEAAQPVTEDTAPRNQPVTVTNLPKEVEVPNDQPHVEDKKPSPTGQESIAPIKYTLIIGSFRSASNAIAFVRTARDKGVRTEVVFHDEAGLYYVFIPDYTTTEDVTVEQLMQIRDKIPFKDAWYKSGVQD